MLTFLPIGIGVDNVDGAFRDGLNGAFGQTGAASHAFVGNYLHYGRDALVGVALFLTMLAKSGKKVSEIRTGLPA